MYSLQANLNMLHICELYIIWDYPKSVRDLICKRNFVKARSGRRMYRLATTSLSEN